ncbi:MAG: DUF3419 family protein [Planctomycetota bacterium]
MLGIQFAVVREDPEVEREILTRRPKPPRRLLLVGSGGCTAFSLQTWWPDLEVVLVEPNPSQVELIQQKQRALETASAVELHQLFDIGPTEQTGLSQTGSFESLFRQLRRFVEEFVADGDEIRRWFQPGRDVERLKNAFENRYWSVAFEMFFSDVILEAMFTNAATQHAPPGSYPPYFRARFERGLLDDRAITNPFLHHVWLGHYRPRADCLPPFLSVALDGRRHQYSLEFQHERLESIDSFASFDLIDLSNVMDWMMDDVARLLAGRVAAEMDVGGTVLWRQLNNAADRRPWFGSQVEFDSARDLQLTQMDRSLFYERIHAGTKARP